MRNTIVFAVLIIAFQACSSHASENSTLKSPELIAVKIIPVQQVQSASVVNVTGLLTTENEARLSFKVAGVIEEISVKEGQRVKKGQLLASLKPTEIQAQLQMVKIALEKAERDYERAMNLYKDSVATLEQFQNARSALQLARENYQQVSFNRDYAKIYAPADGFIVKKISNVGEITNPSSAVLVMNALSSSSKWVLKAGIADRDWSMVQKGNRATVSFDAFPGETFDAVVSKKALSADGQSGSFEVELQLNIAADKAAAGLFGRATIHPTGSTKGFIIPYEALIEANGNTGYVFVTTDQKTVRKIAVTIGEIKEEVVQITSGLENERYLVTSGSPFLNERSKIVVSK
jgi:RND family efflux transporter MFP subunit